MNLECFETEIAPKGKAYLVLREGPAEGLGTTCATLEEQGATQLYLASQSPADPLMEGILDGLRLTFAHDMLGLTCPLNTSRPEPEARLTLEPLAYEKKDLFLRIYNESFFAVPNSTTYDDEAFAQIMGPEYRCGFALLGDVTVGIYELGFKKEHPEIGSIGLAAPYLGKGLGRALLLAVMDYLTELGHTACWLQVATANENAHKLYQSVGFAQPELLSRWFEVKKADG